MSETFDAIIIGTGQAASGLAGRLTGSGRTVAVIERAFFGGTCVNTGCTPTKTMVASARAAHMARRAADFGVVVGGRITVDMAAVRRRKDDVLLASRNGVRRRLEEMDGCTVIEASARFEAPKRVRAGGRLLEADAIFIDVGGRPRVPDWPGLDEVPWLDNASVMELDTVPEHLVVVGGSYVGLEFAQIFRRLGSRVTVVEQAPRILGREDEDVSAAIRAILEGEGIAFRLDAACIAVSAVPAGVRVGLDCSEGPPAVEGSHLLVAVGRVPNTDGLGLEAAGVAADGRGFITVDERLRTSADGVYALGDVNGRGAFTHTAYNDFEIVAANLLDGGDRTVGDRIPTYAVFIDPPLGRVGMSEAEARASGRRLLVARMAMERVARARERGETDGFMKVVVDAGSRRILGAAILGIEGDEAIHVFTTAMRAGMPWETLRDTMFIHPTVSELLPTLLAGLEPA